MKKPIICILGLAAAVAVVVAVRTNLKLRAEKDLWAAATDALA